MKDRIGQQLAAFALGLGVLWSAGVAQADEVQWNRQKGDCEYVLKAPDRYPLPSVQECTILWEQYKDTSNLSPDEKSLFSRGFSWLYLYGDQNQKTLAQGALGRIGKTQPLCLVDGSWRDPNIGQSCTGGGGPDNALKRLPRKETKPAAKGAEKKAQSANSDGLKHYKKRRYAEAVGKFEEALKHDPFYVKAQYNLACNLSLLGDRDGAINALLELESWEDGEAQASFQKARVDKDFEPMHSDARFRQLVGLVRVQLLNGADEPGLFHVGRLYKDLKSRNYYIAQYGYDRHIRKRPLVYYRKGYEAQAGQIKDIVANIRTALIEIKFDSPFDIIVVWGDPDVAKQEGVSGPITQGSDVKADGGGLDGALNKFKEVKGKTEEAGKTVTEPPALPGQ